MFSVETYATFINVQSGWRTVSVNDYMTWRINDSLRLVSCTYYRTNYNYAKTSTSYTLHNITNTNYTPYLPKHSVKFAMYNSEQSLNLNSQGVFETNSHATGSQNINGYAMWYY